MITDEELLAAVRSAGEPGTDSNLLARRLYREAVREWKEGNADWQAEYARRAEIGLVIALIAEAAEEAGWLGGCGTYGGYNRHLHDKTPVCPPCRKAMRDYTRGRYRARVIAALREHQPGQAAA